MRDLFSPSAPLTQYSLSVTRQLDSILYAGDTVNVPGVALQADGQTVPVDLRYASGDTNVVRVLPSGRLAVLAPGRTTLTVRPSAADLLTDTLHAEFPVHAAVPVLAGQGDTTLKSLHDSLLVTARAQTRRGQAITTGVPPITWSVLSGTSAALRNAVTGLVEAVDTGVTTLRAVTDSATRTVVITVRPVPTALVFRTQPVGAGAGGSLGAVAVELRDARGNLVVGAQNSVTLTLAGGRTGAHLRGTATRAAGGGIATFPGLSVDSVGTAYTLAAAGTGLASATSTAFAISPAAPAALVIVRQPSRTVAGQRIQPSVQVAVRDSLGNTVASATNAITVTLGGPGVARGATLSGTLTVNAVVGVASFDSLVVQRADTAYTLTAVSAGLSSATSAPYQVVPAAASVLRFVNPPSTTGPGIAIAPAVQVEAVDAFGNRDTTYTGQMRVAITAGTGATGARLTGDTVQAGVRGLATYSLLTIDLEAQGYTLTATAMGGGLQAAVSDPFDVWRTRLAFLTTPRAVAAGAVLSPAVRVAFVDASSNVLTTATDTIRVHLSAQQPGSHLLGDTALVAVAGVAQFGTLRLDSAGAGYRLTATATGIPSVTSDTFSVNPGSPYRVRFLTQPASRTGGVAFSPPVQVALRDSVGNRTPAATTSVTLRLVAGTGRVGAKLRGDTVVAAVAGIAQFATTSVDSAGTGYRLAAVASGLRPDTSAAFEVAVGTVAQVTATPAAISFASLGRTFAFQVVARDLGGNAVGNAQFTWTALNPAIATVDQTGLVTSVANGTTSVIVTEAGGAADTVTINVGQAVAAVAVTPDGVAISGVGTTTTLAASMRDAAGGMVVGAQPTWASLNAAVATVDAALGVVTAVATGQVTIAASVGSVTGYAVVTVAIDGAAPNLWAETRIPSAAFTLYGVWGTSETNVYAVGGIGTILRYDGTSWAAMTSGATQHLNGVWGTSSSNVYAVGLGGTILRYNGTSWAASTSGTTTPLYGTWGTSPTNVYAVGASGTILRFDGTTWAALASGTAAQLNGVWGTSATNVFAVGAGGTILRYNGTSWAAMTSGTINPLYGVWGTSPTNVFAVGTGGTILRFDGTSWGTMTSGTSSSLYGIWGTSPTNVFAVGNNGGTLSGTMLRFDGTTWAAMTSGTADYLQGVWGASPTSVVAVGVMGTIVRRLAGATVTVTPAATTLAVSGATVQLSATAKDAGGATVSGVTLTWTSSAPAVATVSTAGLVTAQGTDGTATITATALGGVAGTATVTLGRPRAVVTPAGASLSGVGTTTTLAVEYRDEAGAVVTGKTWTWASLNPAVATVDAAGVVTAVAAGQVSVSATADGVTGYALVTVSVPAAAPVNLWAPEASGTTNSLNGVWGTSPANVYAVGASGTILRWNGSSWAGTTSGTISLLTAIWGTSASSAFSVGAGGTIRRWDGTSWASMTSGTTQTLYGVWGTSPTSVFAVGAGGTILRWTGTTWSAMTSGTTNALFGVWGTSETNVFAVGAGGTVLRYDGTTWATLTSGTTFTLQGVWGTSPTNVYAVGYNGTILRWDGTNWVAPASGTSYALYGVWGTSPTNVYAVGSGAASGTILRFDGANWAATASGTTSSLNGVWGTSPTNVVAVSLGGMIVRGLSGATVTVTPAATTLAVSGATVQLSATAKDAGGATVSGVTVTWTSSAPAVATVSTAGLVTAQGTDGTATITATALGGVAGTATVTLGRPRAVVTPAGASLSGVGTTTTLAVEYRDEAGAVVTGKTWTWASLNPAVATVDAAGVVTAVAAGQVSVSATADGVTGYAVVTVAAPAATPVSLWTTSASPTTNSLLDVWAANPNDAWAVGASGVAVHFNGSAWTGVLTGTTDALNSVWGAGPSAVYAVGGSGRVLRYNGSVWDTLPRFTTSTTLAAIWGASPADLFVAAGTQVYHYDGTAWRSQANLPNVVNALWGTSRSDVWAVGGSGQIYRYDGTAWTAISSPTSATMYAVWGTAANDVYIVGAGRAAFHWNGSTWTTQATGTIDSWWNLRDVWGTTESDVYVGGANWVYHDGSVLRYNGSTWSTVVSDTAAGVYGVGGTSGGSVWAVGEYGAIRRGVRASVSVTPATATVTALGATVQLAAGVRDANGALVPGVTVTWSSSDSSIAVPSSSGLVTAIGGGVATIRATAPGGAVGSATVTVDIPVATVTVTPRGATVTTVGGTQAFAADLRDSFGNPSAGTIAVTWTSLNPNVATVSGSGTVTAVAAGQVAVAATAAGVTGYALLTVAAPAATPVNLWTTSASPTTKDLRDVWAASPNDAWAVGIDGVAVHFDGSTWTGVLTGTTDGLSSVWGAGPGAVYAVGGSGRVLRYNGSVWDTLPRLANSGGAIWGASPTDIFVGTSFPGQIYHYDGRAWTEQASLPNEVLGLWGTSGRDVWAVGGSGQITHYDGTAWTAVFSPTSNYLYAVWGTAANDVYIVGDEGVVFRWNGSTWTTQATGALPNVSSWWEFRDVWGTTGSDVYVGADNWVYNDGLVRRYDGSTWSTVVSDTAAGVYAVGGTSGGSVWAVGQYGAIRRGVRASVSVTPATATVTAVGATVQLAAEVRDANGAVVPGVTFTWSSSDSAIAVPSSSGLVRAIGGGVATIRATAPGGAVGSATVTVDIRVATVTVTVDIPVASVTVTPAGATITTVGGTQAFAADLRDSFGNPSAGTIAVTWTSLNPNVATVDGSGTVTAVAAGQVAVAATAAGVTGYALLTVAAPAATPVNLWTTSASPTTNSLLDVWAANPNDAWAVGASGVAVHFNGSAWTGVLTGTTDALNSVWGAGPSAVYAVGSSGRLLRYNGSAWDTLPRFTTSTTLQAIWGASPADIFVAADTKIFHYDGRVWTEQASLPNTVSGLWGTSGRDVWAVGGSGQIYRYDGTAWTAISSPTSATMYAVWGTAANDVYIVGAGRAAFHWNGSTWTTQAAGGIDSWWNLRDVWGTTESDVYVGGANWVYQDGSVLRYNGSSWSTVVSDTAAGVYGVGGTSGGSVWAVGEYGAIRRGVRASVNVTPASPTIAAGSTVQLAATVRDEQNNPMSGVAITWTTGNAARATVSSSGLVTGVSVGTVTITANVPGGGSGGVTVTVLVPPSAPSGLTAGAISTSEIDLSWTDNATNEDGFRIERCAGSGCSNFAQIGTVGAGVTMYQDVGVANGTSYTYRVIAYNAIASSAYSNSASATAMNPPAAPSGLSATPISSSQVTLAWTDNAGNEEGYRIERCSGSGCSAFSQIGTVGADVTSYQDLGVGAGTSYTYRVRAYNSGASSSTSNTATATTPGTPSPPAAPSGITASPMSTSEIDLSWMDNSINEDGFRIERCAGAGCSSFAEIGTVGPDVTSYQSTGLGATTSYAYRVRAYNSGGNSSYSATVTAWSVTSLQSGVGVSGIEGTSGSPAYWAIVVPVGTTQLQVVISGGTGDADLYVRSSDLPTTSLYDCRPYTGTNNETCTMSSPTAGNWYVMLNAFAAYSGVSLTATRLP